MVVFECVISCCNLHLYKQVSPAVSTAFVQQIVHMDKPKRNATVLGQVDKSFVMTPDVDRLLNEILNGAVADVVKTES